MTSIESFQIPKPRYEGQDHGTRGAGGSKYEQAQKEYAQSNTTSLENNARFDEYLKSEAIKTGFDDYLDGLTSDQLQQAADNILDASEKYTSESIVFTLEQWKEKQENDFKAKLEEYKRLYDLHLELAAQLANDPTNAELAALKAKIGEQAQQLEDSFGAESWNNDMPPTVNEMGRKTEKEIRDALLKAATLDNDYSDDDNGDYDGNSHIRITNTSPFDK